MTTTLANPAHTDALLKPCVRCDVTTRPRKGPDQHAVRCGRGLCGRCYHIASRNGTLENYPRLLRARADVLADWRILRARGMTRDNGFTRADVAACMGMTLAALDQVLVRARRAGETVAA